MVEVMLDGERYVIDGGVFDEGPVARANEIKAAVKLAIRLDRSGRSDYIPDMDWYIGDFMEKQYGGKITKWEPLPEEDGDGYEVVY